MHLVAIILLFIGTLIASVNFSLSFIRPLLLRRTQNRKSVSGLPLLGSLFLWTAAWLLYPSSVWAYWALGISLIDTGGPHWFLGNVLYHSYIRKRSREDALPASTRTWRRAALRASPLADARVYYATAHPSDSTSACSSTVCVARSCLSGG
jgi:hypothetical protein